MVKDFSSINMSYDCDLYYFLGGQNEYKEGGTNEWLHTNTS